MSTTQTNSKEYNLSSKGHIVGGLFSAISMFLPAISVAGFSVSLINNPRGSGVAIFFIVISLISVGVGLLKKRWLHILSLFLGAAVAGVAMIYLTDARSTGGGASIGIGLWFMLLGGLIVIVSAVLGLMRK